MKFTFTILALFCFSFFLNAQNTNCANAEIITASDMILMGGFPSFYSFTPPSSGSIDLSSCTFGGHPIVNVYDDCFNGDHANSIQPNASSTCGDPNTCNLTVTETYPVSANNTIYISVQVGTCGSDVRFIYRPENPCEAVQEISCNSSVQGFISTTDPSFFDRSDYENGCASFLLDPNDTYSGGDKLYQFTLPIADTVTLRLTNEGEGVDFDMFLMRGICDESPSSCVAADPVSLNGDEVFTTFLQAGTYYIIVDDYLGSQSGSYVLELECPAIDCDCGNGTIICDNFEFYENGAITPQSSNWQLWSANSFDAPVVDTMSQNGSKSLLIERTTVGDQTIDPDVVLQLGQDYTGGEYQISFSMYVEPGRTGYYNIQHSSQLSHWAFETFFDVGGNGRLVFGAGTGRVEEPFSYPVGQWFRIVQTINLFEDEITLAINGNMIKNWPFSIGTTGQTPNNLGVLSAVNFYAVENAKYYIDDFCFSNFICDFITIFEPVCANGISFSSPFFANCYGITQTEPGFCDRCDYAMDICCDDNMSGNTACELDDFNNNQEGGLGFCGPFLQEEGGDVRSGETPYSGRDKLFRIYIAEPTTINITATFETHRMDLFLLQDCNEEACYLARGFSGENGNTEDLEYTFGSNEIGFFYILIDGWTASDWGPYTITTNWSCTDNLSVFCPSNREIGCEESSHPDNTGYPDPAGGFGNEEVSFQDEIMVNGCDTVITRTWTVSNSCESATCVQTITKRDFNGPIITCPPNVTIDCSDSFDPEFTGVPEAFDQCDNGVNFTHEDFHFDYGCNEYQISRTWMVTDNCGNQGSNCFQDIFVRDNTPPIITCPADVTLDCSEEFNTETSTGQATAEDICLGVVTTVPTTFIDTIVSPSCPRVIRRTWRATDDCGNVATCQQTITYTDNTPPVIFGGPADVTVQCDSIPPQPGLQYSDDCGESFETFSETIIPGNCDHSYTLERRWIIADHCGNETVFVQQITVIDNIAPIISCPPDRMVECGESTDPIILESFAFATDNCDEDPTIDFSDQNPDNNCSESGGIIRTWTATDHCGNTSSCTQRIIIQDDAAPVINGCPENITANCGDVPNPPTLSATDNCDLEVEVVLEETMQGDSCNITVTRLWTATDDCGNFNTCSQTITINDNEAPIFEQCPEPATVPCDDIPDAPTLSAVDNCDETVAIDFEESTSFSELCAATGTITRLWTATDNCGNQSVCSQLINFEDNTPPVFDNCPTNITVECDAIPEMPTLTATDNCSEEIIIEFSEDGSGNEGCPNEGIIFRFWSATDECGNQNSCSQQITYQDTTPPQLSGCPEDTVVECDQIPPVAQVSATDNCTLELEVEFGEDFTFDETCLGNRTIFRNWTATDECGNVNSCAQQIEVQDNTPPSITCPANTTIDVDDSRDPNENPALGMASGQDNCSEGVTTAFTDNEEGLTGCNGTGTLSRSWTATDECGNAAVCEQQITIEDNNPINLAVQDVVDATCGAANGQITVSVANSEGDVQYSIDGGNSFQSSNIFSNLAGDVSYTIIARDDTGCDDSVTQAVAQTPAVAIEEISTIDDNCTRIQGSIEVFVNSEAGGLTYSLNDGEPQESNTFTNLGTGSYTLIVEDANGCQDTMPNIFINDSPPAEINSVQVISHALCGEATGSLEITASDPNEDGNLSYSIDGENFQTSNVFASLPPDDYPIFVQTETGCVTALDEPITIENQASPIIGNIDVVPDSCGNETGVIIVEANGGTGELQYALEELEEFQTSNTFTGLAGGNYNVIVRDANNCEDTQLQEVVILAPPSIEGFEPSPASCEEANGSIRVIPVEGTAPYQFSIDGGVFQDSDTFSDLLGDASYNFTIRDANGCTASSATELENLASPIIDEANIIVTPDTCSLAGRGGRIIVSVSSGTGNYTYFLDGVMQPDSIFENVAAGEHQISVSDENCDDTAMTTVELLDVPVISAITVQNDTCDLNNGSILIEAEGNTALTYTFEDEPFEDGFFSDLDAANYPINISDDFGCQIDTTVAVVDDGSAVEVTIASIETSGLADNDGTICASDEITLTASADNGTAPYTFVWSNGATGESQTLNLAEDSTLTVSVSDAIQCMGENSSTVTVLAVPDVGATVLADACEGEVLDLEAASNADIVSCSWEGPNGFISEDCDPSIENVSDDNSGAYMVTVTDNNNCQNTDEAIVTIISPTAFPVDALATPDALCENEFDNTVQLIGNQYEAIESFGVWTSPIFDEPIMAEEITVEDLPYGETPFTYTLRTDFCTLADTTIFVWFEQPPIARDDIDTTRENIPIRSFDILSNDNVFIGDRQNLRDYEISVNDRELENVTITVNADNTLNIEASETFFGDFSFTYELYSPLCNERATATVRIHVSQQQEEEYCIFDTQENEGWIPCFPVPETNELVIMNRYGKVVFVAKNYVHEGKLWNGSLPVQEEGDIPDNRLLAPTGTYYFILKDKKETEMAGVIMGSIFILR